MGGDGLLRRQGPFCCPHHLLCGQAAVCTALCSELSDGSPQRIAGITAMLQQSLEGLLLEGLQTSNVDIIRHCLRTYATIDKTRDAEALVGQVLVKPYVNEVCVSGVGNLQSHTASPRLGMGMHIPETQELISASSYRKGSCCMVVSWKFYTGRRHGSKHPDSANVASYTQLSH